MPAFTQLPVHGDGDDDASPPASPHLPALEYGAAAGAAALGVDGVVHSDEEDVLMADGSRSRAHSHSLQRSPQVGGGGGGGAAAGWSMDSGMRESFAGQAAGSMRGGGRARLQPQQSDEEELKEEKREEPGTTLRRLRPFYVHQWLDVRDTQDSWLEAQVLAVDPPDPLHSDAASAAILEAHPPPAPAAATSASASPLPEAAAAASSSSPPPPPASQSDQRWIRVHYKGFASKYDEWMDVSSDRSTDMLRRIAPLHAHTRIPHPQVFPPCFNNIGDKIDCKDTIGQWHPATVTDWNGAHAQVKIQYDKWSEKFAEWIDVQSYRLQPLGRFTQQTFQPVAGPVARGARGAGARPSGAAAASASSAVSSSAAATAASIAHFQASSSTEGRFRTLLSQKLGYDIVDQKEDGNCLFRSVSHQVYGDAAHHALVRESCMRYIEDEKGFFQNFIAGESFEQYIGRMKLDGEWGDNVELQAMSEIYERPIEIYAYSHRPLKTFMSSAATSGDGAAGPGTGAAGARPPPSPIRLSYHFASHYNSVIHPQRHRAQCTTLPPGRLEVQALERAARMRLLQEQQRAAVAAAAASSSAAAATPEIPGSASLAQCRETFSSSQSRLAANPDGFEHAVAASLNELDRVLAEEIEQAQQASLREMEEAAMVEATCQQSEREQLEAQLAAATAATKDGDAAAATSSAAVGGGVGGKASKPTVEDEILRQALAASLAAAPAGAVGALSEEEQIAQALRLSAAAAGGGAGQPSSSGLSAEEAAVQSAMRASMADSGVGGAASSGGDQLPPAVLACAELGFPLELCVQAYTLLANDADAALARTNSAQPDLVQRMMDYLCSG